MSAEPALEVTGLARSFGGFRAVDGVSFRVGAGEVVALIGPNGAGKSTLFNLINGQIRPDAGHVRLGGRDVTGLTPRRLWALGMGRTFQITATYPSMTVAENIAVALMPARSGLWSPERMPTLGAEEVRGLIEDVGLGAHAESVCSTLAYGDLKRVELAMVLAGRPRLLLMDEPTAGMAAASRESLMAGAVANARARGAAILFTEHDMGVVFSHAERVLVLSEGRLIADGAPEAVRADPRVREVYLGSSYNAGEATSGDGE